MNSIRNIILNNNYSRYPLANFSRLINTQTNKKDADIPKRNIVSRTSVEPMCSCDEPGILQKCSKSNKCQYRVNHVPVYIKTYGCQMNLNDAAIVASIMKEFGYNIIEEEYQAEIVILMTCSIRDSAESKVWSKIYHLKSFKENKNEKLKQIGLLGCMAERIKEKALDPLEGSVDIVAGPDAYRDLPRLFGLNRVSKEKAVNCLLSFDETYSDIRPVTNIGDVSSFVSITRGCDNLCSYCIVPFTRGRERSRTIGTIIEEIKDLISKGIKEVTLLGQNVNSYRDLLTPPESLQRTDLYDLIETKKSPAEGFKTVYKPRTRGISFDILLEEIAKLSPELRIRFTSPHPKDFTEDVIDVMAKYPNICRCIHLPAQSGSDQVLDRMRRGYTRQAYYDLVDRIRAKIPEMNFTTDIIVGFSGETEQDHIATLELIDRIKYNYVFAFPYSSRAKTHAYYKYPDNVDDDTKRRRTGEVLRLFREQVLEMNSKLIGSKELVLVESVSKRSKSCWKARTSGNSKTIIPKFDLIDTSLDELRPIQLGDYVVCEIEQVTSESFQAMPLYLTTQEEYLNTQINRNTQSTS